MTDMVHLVEQAKSGNPRAQSIIYARFRKRALAVCTSITHNKEISEELTDDAFLIAFSKLDTLNDPEKFGSWVVTISARLALRYLKCQPCDKPIPFSHIEGFDIPCSPHDPPLSLEELQAAVNLLPEGYRQVFVMSVIEGRKHNEIASLLNIGPHSSSSQLCHARAMLRRILRPLLCLVLTALPLVLVQDHISESSPSVAQSPNPMQVVIPSVAETTSPLLHVVPSISDYADSPSSLPSIADSNVIVVPVSSPPTVIVPSLPSVPSEPGINTFICRHQPAVTAIHSRWTLALTMSPVLSPQAEISRPHPLILPSVSVTSSADQHSVSIDNWHDCKAYILENSGLFTPEVASALIRIAQSNVLDNNGQIVRTEYHQPPTSLALTVHYALDSSFSLYTGVSHTIYRSYFQTGVGVDRIDQRQSLSLLGIPLGVSFCPRPLSRFGCHFSLGLSLQLPLSLQSTTAFVVGGDCDNPSATSSQTIPLSNISSSVDLATFKAGFSLGVHYRLTPHLSLLAEGTIGYTFPCRQEISTYATVHPLSVTMQSGLSFAF